MDNIKEKYHFIKSQVELLKPIQKYDKIYLSNNMMYLQKYTLFQCIYRRVVGENRLLTFNYIENFISKYFLFSELCKKTIKYLQNPEIIQIINELPTIKNDLIEIIKTLECTYPENKKSINMLIENLNN